MVEQRPFKALVAGSSPARPTSLKSLKSLEIINLQDFQSDSSREAFCQLYWQQLAALPIGVWDVLTVGIGSTGREIQTSKKA